MAFGSEEVEAAGWELSIPRPVARMDSSGVWAGSRRVWSRRLIVRTGVEMVVGMGEKRRERRRGKEEKRNRAKQIRDGSAYKVASADRDQRFDNLLVKLSLPMSLKSGIGFQITGTFDTVLQIQRKEIISMMCLQLPSLRQREGHR